MAAMVSGSWVSAGPLRRLNGRDSNECPVRIAVSVPILSPMISFKSSVIVRASEPQGEEINSSTNDPDRAFTSQEDQKYLWTLGAGSIAGAAAIKYGSILFPELTRPNILEAMLLISAPVIIAVLLLFRQSHLDQQ